MVLVGVVLEAEAAGERHSFNCLSTIALIASLRGSATGDGVAGTSSIDAVAAWFVCLFCLQYLD